MKEMKLVSVSVFGDRQQKVNSPMIHYTYPDVDDLLSFYANKGYEVKAMTEFGTAHVITILFEREV